MGFTTGFTGGVAVTLSVAYLTVLAHQRNREQQGAALRAQALALQSIIDPLPAPLPPTRSEVAAAQRATSIEVAKDRWNHEVENAVRWAQHTDWDEVRDSIEEGALKLWSKAFGESAEETATKVEAKAENIASKAKGKAEEVSSGVAAAAKDAYSKAKVRGQTAEQAAENKALEARLWTKKETAKAEDVAKDKADEAKGLLSSAWESGKGKAREFAGIAKGVAGAVEEKVERTVSPPLDPIQRALQQRYERPEAKVNKTVAEALQERYTPLDKRDNTVLRGV